MRVCLCLCVCVWGGGWVRTEPSRWMPKSRLSLLQATRMGQAGSGVAWPGSSEYVMYVDGNG